jgi:hypothetical protein
MQKKTYLALFSVIGILLFLLVGTNAYWLSTSENRPSVSKILFPVTPTPTWPITAVPTNGWFEFFSHTPVAWTTPFPPPTATVLDGTYVKFDPTMVQWWTCKRCPDWRPAGGTWRLSFDKGVFRIYYDQTGWKNIGSYTVNGDRLFLFNDPTCNFETGQYTWTQEKGILRLKEVSDTCAIKMRALNLTHYLWYSCQPPNKEAAITDHWIKPKDCY